VEDLPKADVEAEFHSRLLLMEGMRQLDEDTAIPGNFCAAVMATQEECELVAGLRVTRPQANLQ
jgi:hypothetical protein